MHQIAELMVPASKLHADLGDALRFETLLSDLSAKFVRLAPGKIEGEIEHALREVGEFFHADRCGLMEVSADEYFARAAYAWYAAGAPKASAEGNFAPIRPWTFERVVVNREDLSFEDPNELPPEASVDKQEYLAIGVRAMLLLPLLLGEEVHHLIIIQTMSGEKFVSPEYRPRLRLLGEILVNALARKDAEKKLRESEDRMSLAVDLAEAGLWTLEFPSGKIWATAKARALFGASHPGELTFDKLVQTIHPKDRHRVQSTVDNAIETTQESNAEFRVLLPGRIVRWIGSRGRAHSDLNGTSVRLTGACVDITRRKQAEQRLSQALEEVQRLRDQLQRDNLLLRQEVRAMSRNTGIIGDSPALRESLSKVGKVAPTNSTVLLVGETGTGKELFASAIHDLSPRNSHHMIRMNCAAIPTPLIESELFGREKGAYTGAVSKQIGRFEMAHRSTLFLDEISEIPMDVQVKLLRVLQEKQIERLGNPKSIDIDVRIIAATNKDLENEVREGRFREDLYYRLSVFPITIPPLRERRDDIPLLTLAFLEEFATALGKHVDAISQSSMDALMHYSWPGNIRELRNVLERTIILATDRKVRIDLPNGANGKSVQNLTMQDVERKHLLNVLTMAGWKVRGKDGAAAILGLKPTTLTSRMNKLGVKRPISWNDISSEATRYRSATTIPTLPSFKSRH